MTKWIRPGKSKPLWTRDPVYPSQEELLADQNGLAQPPPEGVKLPPSRAIPLAGFAVTILRPGLK